MLQDISPYVFHNEYAEHTPEAEDIVFVFKGRAVLSVRDNEGYYWFPTVAEFDAAADPATLQYLFEISGRRFFLLRAENPDAFSDLLPGCSFHTLLDVADRKHMAAAFAAMTAFHLHTWYDRNKYCGKCGSGMRLEHDKNERMLRCSACGNMVFPTIAPAVIIGVTWGEKLLMTKYAGREYGGWALMAGFCEIGETVEDTVCREAMEEAGVHVKNLRYAASQPWGSDSNLLMGFFCDVDGDPTIHMDESELATAVWVDRADIPEMEDDNISLTKYMIDLFKKGEV